MFLRRPDRLIPRQYRDLLMLRRFRRLLPALLASDLGDGMSVVAVAWLAVRIAPPGGSGPVLGIALAAYSLPGAVGALLFGRWVRRLPARRLLCANSTLRAVFLGCVPLASAGGLLDPVCYTVLLAASSLLHAWGGAAKYALVAELVPEEERLAANALLSTSGWASTIAGPALAGLLAAAVGPAWIIGLDALSFAVLALGTGLLGGPPAAPSAGRAPGQPVGRAWQLLRRRPELLGLLAVTWFLNVCWGPVEVALPLFVKGDLGAGAGMLGLYWAVFGAGAIAGALAVGALRRLPLWPVVLGIVAGHGVILLPFALDAPAVVSLGAFTLGGVIYGPYSALCLSLFQNRTPEGWLTTILAFRSAVLLTAAPLGAALGGPLSAAIGARNTLAVAGLGMVLVAAIAGWVLVVGRRRPAAGVPERHTEPSPLRGQAEREASAR
ncbi:MULTISPECIES: MFS transporter [Kitasatospora]|uniref:MFS transporter n=1 Tax=Kitasatospora cystarginea TaxID=58350 RepID=A0ABN3E2F6_9ACTN